MKQALATAPAVLASLIKFVLSAQFFWLNGCNAIVPAATELQTYFKTL